MSLSRFVGRTAELGTLSAAYASAESGFVPIYGRRRVGKSELILRFLREHPGVYFLGKQAPAALQLREFLDEAAVVLGEPLLATASFDGWKSALSAVIDRWKQGGKLVLVFDEFQWTAWASPELPSVLQDLWDRRWRSSGKILLILCGSYVGFMEREVLGRKSPLFGRRTAQILLRPFGYREAALFHPSFSTVDRARAYFICGGVPWYLERFDAKLTGSNAYDITAENGVDCGCSRPPAGGSPHPFARGSDARGLVARRPLGLRRRPRPLSGDAHPGENVATVEFTSVDAGRCRREPGREHQWQEREAWRRNLRRRADPSRTPLALRRAAKTD